MKAIVLLVLLALPACANPVDGDAKNARDEAEPVKRLRLTALESRAKASLEARARTELQTSQLEARAKKAMEAYLFDPFSARFRTLSAGRGGAVCGEYNAKNRLNAYTGFKDFVVSRDGKTIYASQYNDGVDTEMYTSFAEAYLNACATQAEVAEYRLAYAALNPSIEDEEPYVASPTDSARAAFSDAEAGSDIDANMTMDANMVIDE